jgi:hypothetical protein
MDLQSAGIDSRIQNIGWTLGRAVMRKGFDCFPIDEPELQ